MGILIEVAVAKTNKYASRESGDTAEVVERPGGGLSAVVVDGQGSGRAAKTLSLLLTSRAVALLKDGVRDGAVAQAVHDFLYTYRHGQVSATLDLVSADLASRDVVATRNAVTPLVVRRGGVTAVIPPGAGPIGVHRHAKPAVHAFPFEEGLRVLTYTDGVARAGSRGVDAPFDVAAFLDRACGPDAPAQDLADAVLAEAMRRDAGRPADDLTVVALVLRRHEGETSVRRLAAALPLP